MNPTDTQTPPAATTPGRLRQPRPWPYATRPTGAPLPETDAPEHDLLRLMPEPALAGDLPPPKPAPARDRLTAAEAIALAPLPRTFWFDL